MDAPRQDTRAAQQLDNSAAMLRAESGHVDATLQALVERLSSVPGLKLSVAGMRVADPQRPGLIRRLLGDLPYVNDLHRGDDPDREMTVSLGSSAFWLRSSSGALECGRTTTTETYGTTNETMAFSAWAGALFDEIDRENLANHESMVALRQLVEQDRLD